MHLFAKCPDSVCWQSRSIVLRSANAGPFPDISSEINLFPFIDYVTNPVSHSFSGRIRTCSRGIARIAAEPLAARPGLTNKAVQENSVLPRRI